MSKKHFLYLIIYSTEINIENDNNIIKK